MKQSELETILYDHELWLNSDGARGKFANFAGANFAGADLRGVYLAGANLVGADLAGANLAGADLWDADLRGANLAGATFTTNFKKVRYFFQATFSEEQISWVCLHPAYPEWAHTLEWVKARQLSA